MQQVSVLLAEGRSVLLFGPEAIGKSAIVAAAAREGIRVVDPFERISGQSACDMRRALDHGGVFLCASRVLRGRELGSVGRILRRFSPIRIRELPDSILRHLVVREMEAALGVDDAWLREVASLARGRPGFAIAMGRFAKGWATTHGYLPLPSLVFAVVREDAAIRGLKSIAATRDPGVGGGSTAPASGRWES